MASSYQLAARQCELLSLLFVSLSVCDVDSVPKQLCKAYLTEFARPVRLA